jgi:hypothetical protein
MENFLYQCSVAIYTGMIWNGRQSHIEMHSRGTFAG